MAAGVLTGGMIPKVTACVRAVAQRRAPRPHPRRPRAPRAAARAVHRLRHRHHDPGREPSMTHRDAVHAPADLAGCPLMPTYGPPPVKFVRGRGTELWDADGNRYLDFLSGLAVTSLGHSHPAVAEALHEQAQTLLHVSNLFATPTAAEVAITLDRLVHRRRRRAATLRGRCSSATAAPRPTSAPSSWPAGGAAAAGHVGRSVGLRVASTAGPSPPCTPPVSRPSTRRSSRCPRASATWPGTTSTPWPRPSTRRSPRCCSSRCRARAA